MRVISSIQFDGVEYLAVWAPLKAIDRACGTSAAMVLAIRDGEGANKAIIPRNAKLADVQASLHHLRGLGLGESQLAELFNHKGKPAGLAQHVKVLVANLR